MDLTSLKRLAEAATPGPWHHNKDAEQLGEVALSDGHALAQMQQRAHRDHQQRDADARYIAALSPDKLLKLIAVVEAVDIAVVTLETATAHTSDSRAVLSSLRSALKELDK